MSKPKVIYRDVESQRIITRQEAVKRDPESWQEEAFTPTPPVLVETFTRRDVPTVEDHVIR